MEKLKIRKPSNIQFACRGFTCCIEFAETNDKKVYLVTMRSMTKVYFTGTITVKSKIRRVPEKAKRN